MQQTILHLQYNLDLLQFLLLTPSTAGECKLRDGHQHLTVEAFKSWQDTIC